MIDLAAKLTTCTARKPKSLSGGVIISLIVAAVLKRAEPASPPTL